MKTTISVIALGASFVLALGALELSVNLIALALEPLGAIPALALFGVLFIAIIKFTK